MDIRDMKYFYTIAEEGNISNAAKRLNIAQPALSRQIKQFEEHLGVQLFERGSRRIKLTEAGHLMHERVEHILELVEGTKKEIKELHSGLVGTISIGTVTTSGAILLPNLIHQFHQLYPAVTFQLWEGDGFRILELLNKGIIEVGIIRTPFDADTYESITLPPEPLVLAMKKGACYCGEDPTSVHIIELEHQPLIVPIRWKSMLINWCNKAGFTPNIICSCDGIIMNILCAKMGFGMALVPKSTEGLIEDATLTYKTIIDPTVSTQTVVAWLRNRRLSASSQHFLSLLKGMN